MTKKDNSNIKINNKYSEYFKLNNTNLLKKSLSEEQFEGVRKIFIKDIVLSVSPKPELVKKYLSEYLETRWFFAPVYVLKHGEKYYAEGNVEIVEAAKARGHEWIYCKYGTREDAENDNKYREIGTKINFNNEFTGKVYLSTPKKIGLINQNGEKRNINLYHHLKNNSLKILCDNSRRIHIVPLMTDVERAMKEYHNQNKEKCLLANYFIIKKEYIGIEFEGIKKYHKKTRLVFNVNNTNSDIFKPLLKDVTLDGKTVVKQAVLSGEKTREVFEIAIPNIKDINEHIITFSAIVNESIKSDKIIVKFDLRDNLIQVNEKTEKITLPRPIKKTNVIDTRSFAIHSDNYNECVGHNVESVNAVIDIFDGREVKPVNVQAYYCYKCGIYYIKEQEYLRIKRLGKTICQILSLDEYKKIKKHIGNKLNPESILKRFGYSVSQESHLSEKQRRAILEVIIEKNVLSKKETIEYLKFFIRYHPHMSKAIEKWQSDISYLNGYNKGNPRYIKISKIIF
ncbi:hypothetical protein SAMN04487760_10531 [Lachnospiraceae bacterium G41]|nr:hypothetical protein SAMN04487760_10531 [Lachnospiraceae bacterium G41]